MYDLIIVGAGPAGIFTALELLRKSSTPHKILLVEKGKPVEKRHCPKDKTGVCVNCKPTCAITTGFSGAGAFSDGKLSLSYQVGGELPDLIGEDFAQELIDYTDKIYLEFGADPKVEGIYEGPDIKDIRKRAIQAGLQLVDCPIRHLGTEKAQQLYLNIQNHLAAAGVEMLFNTECENIILEDSVCKGVRLREKDGTRDVLAKQVVIATGRRGADWLEKICAEHNIAHKPGTVAQQGAHLLPEPRRLCRAGKLRQRLGRCQWSQLQGEKEQQHQPCDSRQPQFHRAVQPAHRLRAEGRRADEHAGRRPHSGAALR